MFEALMVPNCARTALLTLSVAVSGIGLASEPIPFESGTLEKIESARKDQPFILHLWSLDCVTCLKELKVLAQCLHHHPDVKLIMVSTDPQESRAEVQRMLEQNGLSQVESWQFGANSQRLRFEIDPQWFGEMPRTYFYDKAHSRTPLTGAISESHIEAWLASLKP